jgi:hypothetical protein
MLRQGGRHLALAVPLGDYAPPPKVVRRVEALAAGIGRRTQEGLAIPLPAGGSHVRAAPPGRARRRRSGRSTSLTPAQFSLAPGGELIFRPSLQQRRT